MKCLLLFVLTLLISSCCCVYHPTVADQPTIADDTDWVREQRNNIYIGHDQ